MKPAGKETPLPVRWEPFSLLWPDIGDSAIAPSVFMLDAAVIRDLELEKLYRQFAGNDRRYMEIEPTLRKITGDADVIAFRQSALADLIRFPELAACLEELLPYFESLQQNRRPANGKDMELHTLAFRLSELENFVICVKRLGEAFEAIQGELDSIGWRRMREFVLGFERDAIYGKLTAELPELCARIRGVRSIAIGVNLDVNLMPCEATLLSIDTERYTGKSESLFSRLFPGKPGEMQGIAQLHSVPLKTTAIQAMPAGRSASHRESRAVTATLGK